MRRALKTASASAALAAAVSLTAGTAWTREPRPAWVPADATTVSDCVEALGYIYWNPKKLPFGPTYGSYDGKPVFEEIMVGQDEFKRGVNFNDVAKPAPPFPIDHVDIWFAPHGHDGFPKPHYDILFFFMPHKQHMHICNPSGKLPSFVLQDR